MSTTEYDPECIFIMSRM